MHQFYGEDLHRAETLYLSQVSKDLPGAWPLAGLPGLRFRLSGARGVSVGCARVPVVDSWVDQLFARLVLLQEFRQRDSVQRDVTGGP